MDSPQIRAMKDFIADRIGQPLSLSMLASQAGYSPWHTTRLFREATGMSPLEYIRALRLSQAALQLQGGEERILEVALDFAFTTHEGFTRAFSDAFGTTPRAYRKSARALFLPMGIREAYLRLQKGEDVMTHEHKPIFVQVVERPARRLILKRGLRASHYFDYCEEVGCDVWGILCDIKDALYEPIGMWMPETLRKPGTSEYCQGVEMPADYAGPVPEGMETLDLPACQMMIFQGPQYDDKDFEQAIGSLWETVKSYKPEFYGFCWADEDGPRFQLEPRGERGYIEGRPVRLLAQK